MSRPIILDIDGVLLDLFPPVQNLVLKKYGVQIRAEDMTTWDWSYALGFPKEHWSEFWDHLWSVPCNPFEGANGFIDDLKSMGLETVGLSTRPAYWEGLKDPYSARAAAERDFGQLNLDRVILVDQSDDKVNKIIGSFPDAEFCVEDSPDNAGMIGRDTNCNVLLLDRPWNRGCMSVTRSWTRVSSYADIIVEISR